MTNQSGLSTGFLTFGNTFTSILSTKHILYILMIILSIFRSLIIDKLENLTPPTKEKLNMIILIINILVGVAVLALSAWISLIPSPV
ncbi:MAG: hypothetical protein ACTSWY_07445, partial [Promethearchaeota archaeon]